MATNASRNCDEPDGGSFLPDGRIAFGTIATRGRIEFHVIDQQTGVVGPLTIEGSGEESAFVVDRGSVFGPDGSVARVLPDGHVEILQPGRGARRVVPGPALADGDDLVEWLGDDQLYIARGKTVPMEVYRIDARTGVRRTWRTLMPADPTGLIGIRNVVIANNGESYACSYRRVTSSDLYLVKSSASVK